MNYVRITGRVMRDAAAANMETPMYFCVKVDNEGGDFTLVDCVALPSTFYQFESSLDKGELVDVKGSLTYRTWTDSMGRRRSGMEVLVEGIDFPEEDWYVD